MRSLLVMGIPYRHAPEVSIVRTDTCMHLHARSRGALMRPVMASGLDRIVAADWRPAYQ